MGSGKVSAGISSGGNFTGNSPACNIEAASAWSYTSTRSLPRDGEMPQYALGLIKQVLATHV